MKHLAVFASGTGTNARELIRHANDAYRVSCVVSDRMASGALEKAREDGVEALHYPKQDWVMGNRVVSDLEARKVDAIILAGFLKLVPRAILQTYSGRILNVHPALLPKHGGKGMYGDNVHRAVLESGDPVSGISIHEVNERFDEGKVLIRYECPVLEGDTIESLRARVQNLEHTYFPSFVEEWCTHL